MDLPTAVVDTIPYPQAVLERKMVKQRNQATTQWLIHWAGSSLADATWEFVKEIQAQFPPFVP